MSLRKDLQAQRKVSRAARRSSALERACDAVVGQGASRPWESLETRVLMSLVHHYPFNEGAGTSTVDPIGGRNGTLMTDADVTVGDQAVVGLAAGPNAPGVSWGTTDPSPAGGSYLHFDGELVPSGTPAVPNTLNNVGGRVDVSADNTLAQSFATKLGFSTSVAAYIRFTDINSTEYVGNDTMWQAPAITGNEQGSFGNDSFHGTILANGRIGMQKSDGTRATSTTSLKDGSWHQVVVTRDYDTGQAKVYVDGRLQNTANTNAGPVSSFWDAIGALTLVGTDGTTLQGYNYMNNVDLDDVRMYDHVLTQGEVNALVPPTLAGPLAVAPVITGVTTDPNNGANATLTFTDANPNEAGFIVERAALLPNGTPGTFVAIGQIGNGTNLQYFDTSINQYNQQMVYRVRPFNTSGEGQNVVSAPFTSSATFANPAGLGTGLAGGFVINQFWGATARQWPTDPDTTDAPTSRNLNNQAENVGPIHLDPATLGDPANPAGIAVRDPEVRAIDNYTQSTAVDPYTGATVGRFRRDWGNNAPNPAVRADSFSSVHSGRLTIPRDFNQNATEGDANVLVKFVAWGDDDTHVYVNGQLVSTDPAGHGARDGGANPAQDPAGTNVGDGTNNGFIALTEGESYDIVVLQSEGTGGAAVGVKWGLVSRNEDGTFTHPALASMAFIPVTYLTPVANRPQASSMTLRGTPNEHMVSFNILDTTTSEQRFELWRKPSTAPDSAYTKVNEAGINSPFISDASAQPGTTYDYILLGVNGTSGYTDLAAAIANKQTVTTTANEAPVQGLKAFYFNDDFWGQGENRPLPANGNLFVGPSAWSLTGADVYERGVNPQQGYGDDNHIPTVRPGGSPHADIRDNSHSTLWVGKLIIKAGEEGDYYILGFGDDDTHVIVNNVMVSSDPNGHGARNPFPTGATNYQPTNNGGFVNPINLTAGEHDIVVLQSEQGGGSGIFLRWLKPGTANPTTATPTDVPLDQLSTGTGAPLAPGKPVVSDPRGSSVAVTAADNATNELRNELVVATDAAFTQNVRRIPVGIRVATAGATNPSSLRITGLTAGTQYFIKAVSMNADGQAESEVETFNTGTVIPPAAPSALVVRPQAANRNLLTFTDNSTDETGFLIQRRRQGEPAFVTIAETGAGVNTYTDTLDATYTPGTVLEYQIVATNNGVNSAASPVVAATPLGGPGGTGLQMRLWNTTVADAAGAQGNVFNPDHVNTYNTTNSGFGRVAEPARNADGSAQAPSVDAVDALIPDNWGAGVPRFETLEVETFAMEWVGWIVAEQTKAYDFSIVTDDGGRLFLDDVEVIDGHWRDGAGEAFSEPVNLTAGQRVKVRFQMYEQGGGATARLRWNGANNNAREDIPAIFLFPDNGTGAGSDPNNAVENVSQRPVSFTEVFALPPVAAGAPGYIAVRWQENAFGESGYDVQRAESPDFSDAVLISTDANNFPAAPERVGTGRSLYIDDGGFNLAGTQLDPTKTYYYRVKPRNAPESAYVVAGSAKPLGVAIDPVTGAASTANIALAGTDLSLTNFASPEMVTLNGWSSVTAEKTLKLVHNQNDRVGSAFLNRAFDVDTDFKVNYDFRIGDSNGADGMTFVIHNYTPPIPATASTTSSQLRAMGPGGGFFGYGTNTDPANRQTGILNSVAVVIDFHDNLDTLGVYTNGKVPPGGVIGNYSANNAGFLRTTPATVASPNGSFDLRNTANLTAGTTAIDVNGGTVYRLQLVYQERGTEVDGEPGPTEFDTGLLTVNLINAADVNQKVLFTAKYNVDLATEVGQDTAVMGWTAGNGGLNAKTEVYNFKYDGPVDAPVSAVVSEVYVRGSGWLGQDNNPATTRFMEYLEAKGLGDDNYGYRLFGPGRTPPAGNDHDILPWINMNQLVVKYTEPPTGAGVPTPGALTVNGVKGAYTVTSVTPVNGDPTAFVLQLNKPLGGGDPATGLAPTPSENGDVITLGVPGGGAAGSNFTLKMNVLQGDTDHLGEGNAHVVLARDYSEIKKKFFKDTDDVPAGTDADYSPFFDVDASGSILAGDYSEVKKRFFQSLTIPAAAGAGMFGATRVAEEVLA